VSTPIGLIYTFQLTDAEIASAGQSGGYLRAEVASDGNWGLDGGQLPALPGSARLAVGPKVGQLSSNAHPRTRPQDYAGQPCR
jgi:hypothetical protein